MKKIEWIATTLMLLIMLNVCVPLSQFYSNTAYADEIAVLSETDARNLLCFLYDKNLSIDDMANDEYFKLLTGRLSGEDADIKRAGFAIYVELRLDSNIQNASNQCDIAYGNLVDLLEERADSSLAQETLGTVQEEMKDSMKSIFNAFTNDEFECLESIYEGVKDIYKIPDKVKKYIDDVKIYLNSLALVKNQDLAARYTYFSSYLTARKSMSPDEEIFRIMMNGVELQLADHYSSSMFDFFPGDKTNWYSYKSDIEKWAEYTYQIIGNPTAKREPSTEPKDDDDPSATVFYNNLIVNNNYTVSSGTLNLNGHNLVVIGDFTQTGGTINVNGGAVIVYGNLNLKRGTINNSANSYVTADSLNMSSGTYINNGYTYVENSAAVTGTVTGNLNIYGGLTASSAKITNLNIYGSKKQTISGNCTVNNLAFQKTSNVNITGTISVNGSIRENDAHIVGGKNVVLNSTGKIIGTTYKNALTLNGANVSDMTFGSTLYTKGNTSLNNVVINNMLVQSETLNLNGDMTVKGDASISGTVAGTAGTLKLYGDLSGGGKISSLMMCSDKKQTITSAITVTDFYNKAANLNVGAAVTVNGKIHSEHPMQNGSNIRLSASGSFGDNTYVGDITLNGISGNLPDTFIGNITAGSTAINLSKPSVIKGKLTLSGTTLNLNGTTLTVNGTYSGSATVNLTDSELILNGITSPGGTITLNNSTLTANKIITSSASITVNEGSLANIKSDMTNSGKITGGGSLNLSGDLVNSGTVNVNTLNINTKNRTLSVSGNQLSTVDLNISGGGALKLTPTINVSGKLTNSGTTVDEDKIVLPFDETAPLKTLTSTNGYTLDGKTVTVNGKCTISGGAVTLKNGARLILNQGFTASGTTFTVDETSEIIIKRYSLISSFSDIVNNGKITFGGDVSLSSTKLSGSGEYVLLGDLYLSSASVNKPNTFTVSGGTPQKLWGGTMNFENLKLTNTSSYGIEFGTAANYSGELIKNAKVIGTLTKTEE